jgi:hypothetical protein
MQQVSQSREHRSLFSRRPTEYQEDAANKDAVGENVAVVLVPPNRRAFEDQRFTRHSVEPQDAAAAPRRC